MRKPVRIFLADDDIDDVELFEDTLYGIDSSTVFHSVSNGLEAMRFLLQHDSPDVIFLDLNMPMADGRKCLQGIKREEKLKKVPVIMFTTSSFPNDIEECLALGASCFICKPTDVVELQTILRVILHNIHDDIVGSLKQTPKATGIYYPAG